MIYFIKYIHGNDSYFINKLLGSHKLLYTLTFVGSRRNMNMRPTDRVLKHSRGAR